MSTLVLAASKTLANGLMDAVDFLTLGLTRAMSRQSASELDELVAFECNEASFSVQSICGSEVTLEKVVCFPDEGGQRGCGLNGKKLPASGASVEIGTKVCRSKEDWMDGFKTWSVGDSLPIGHDRMASSKMVEVTAVVDKRVEKWRITLAAGALQAVVAKD